MSSVVQDLFDKLSAAGLPIPGAQGVVANVLWESGGNPAAAGDRTVPSDPHTATSHGLAQWHLGRWDQFLAYAKKLGRNPMDASTQTDYLVQDVKTYNGGSLWNRLMNATTPAAATADFMTTYERPQDTSQAAVNKRVGTLLTTPLLTPPQGPGLIAGAKDTAAKLGKLLDWQTFVWHELPVVGGIALILIGATKVASPAIGKGVALAGKAL